MTKKFILGLVFLIFGLSFVSAALTDNNFLYYSFDDANLSGSNPLDLTPNGNDGTNNGATTGITGFINEGFDFDGINNYVTSTSTTNSLNLQNITISVWFNTDDLVGQEYIWSYDGNSATQGRRIIYKDGNMVYFQDGGERVGTSINVSQWYHAVLVVENGNDLRAYLDGVNIGNTTGNAIKSSSPTNAVMTVGVLSNLANYFNGKIDEVSVWERPLTSAEVQTLYNSGLGLQYPYIESGSITLNSLNANNETFVNNSFFSTQNILFELNLTNTTTNGNINTTASVYNSSGDLILTLQDNNTLTPTFNVTNLTDSGSTYYISFYSFNNETNATFGNYTFIVDLFPPTINNSLPSEIIVDLDYNINLSNYITCNEIGSGYCNITFSLDSNSVSANSTIYNFTYNGNQSYTIVAVDTAGNNVTETGSILVNPYAYFSFNQSGTLLQNFTFGGVTFNNTDYGNFTLYGSTINGTGNKTFEWSKFGYATQNVSFEVTNTSKINTTYNVSQAIINITIYDKFTSNIVTGENFSVELIGDVSVSTSTITGNIELTNLLFTSGDYQLIVGNGDYSTESVYFTFTNQEILDVSVYVQNTSDPLYGTVVIEGTFASGAPAIGKVAQALQWNPTTSSFVVVSQGLTDSAGKVTLNVILDDKLYKFRLIDGTNFVDSPQETITSDETGKTVPLTLPDTTSSITFFLEGVITNATESYNNVTNTSTITFNWANTFGTDLTGCINYYKIINFKERLAGSSCDTFASGTHTYSFTLNSSEDSNIKAEFLISGKYYVVDNFRHNSIFSLGEVLKLYFLHIFVLLLFYGLSVWIGLFILENIYISALLIMFSSFIAYLVIPNIMTTGIATGIAMMSILTLWGGYTRR